ncbi:MAG: CRISPR-associated helicase Cas3' [Rikenellaceae bacterium]
MEIILPEIKAKSTENNSSLYEHLFAVSKMAVKIASSIGLDTQIAFYGAVLHDIGKVNPIFQKRLKANKATSHEVFRHELASLFFLSLFDTDIHGQLIEMVVAHHKSIINDSKGRGILDLLENSDEEKLLETHLKDWNEWSASALVLLSSFGVITRDISKNEARDNFYIAVDYCDSVLSERRYSLWRAVLMSADYFASAMAGEYDLFIDNIFKKPILDFYNRSNTLYPLSLLDVKSECTHTLVIAPTGAGKTDYLFRRCKGRVFYTLPFQASINAMYERVKGDLACDNPNLDIRILHAASKIISNGTSVSEKVMQDLVGSSVKILTPYQLAAIAFGSLGYESIIADVMGCDIILDEVHTYSKSSQGIVLKLIEVLSSLGCNVHIGSATIPTVLQDNIINILGSKKVLKVVLSSEEQCAFDRHVVHKLNTWVDSLSIIDEAVDKGEKVLVVVNRVEESIERYIELDQLFPTTPKLLLHSKFKRGDRFNKEKDLINNMNRMSGSCIVVSTQVVEVSLDISFDIMITSAAPLDSMIQRFGRINRKRSCETIGKFKPIYIIAPPDDEKSVLPYDFDIVTASYNIIPDGKVLHEKDLQSMIDTVYSDIDMVSIETHSIYKSDKGWSISPLCHYSKSLLVDMLDIDSVSCICESDEETYIVSLPEERAKMEISVKYWVVKDCNQLDCGTHPFVIPDKSYSCELGLRQSLVKQENFRSCEFL